VKTNVNMSRIYKLMKIKTHSLSVAPTKVTSVGVVNNEMFKHNFFSYLCKILKINQ